VFTPEASGSESNADGEAGADEVESVEKAKKATVRWCQLHKCAVVCLDVKCKHADGGCTLRRPCTPGKVCPDFTDTRDMPGDLRLKPRTYLSALLAPSLHNR
jgi:hypothetical protein